MHLPQLLAGVNDPNPHIRLTAIRILGLVEETQAFEVLKQRYATETELAVKQVIHWAGERIVAAGKRGYRTLDDIFDRFKLNQEIDHLEDPREAQLMQQMQAGLDSDLRDLKNQGNTGRVITGAIVGAALGGAMGAMSGAAMGMTPAIDASSNLGSRPTVGKSRIPAQRPGETKVDMWVRRAAQDPTPDGRKKALIEIMNFNNPSALPALAETYFTEADAGVKAELERVVRVLYLNQLYWDLTQNGTVEQEFQKRAARKGKDFTQTTTMVKVDDTTFAQQEETKRTTQQAELAEIMRRAEEARAKRLKKR